MYVFVSLGNRSYLLVVAEKALENNKLFDLEEGFYKLLIRNCYKMLVCLEFFIPMWTFSPLRSPSLTRYEF